MSEPLAGAYVKLLARAEQAEKQLDDRDNELLELKKQLAEVRAELEIETNNAKALLKTNCEFLNGMQFLKAELAAKDAELAQWKDKWNAVLIAANEYRATSCPNCHMQLPDSDNALLRVELAEVKAALKIEKSDTQVEWTRQDNYIEKLEKQLSEERLMKGVVDKLKAELAAKDARIKELWEALSMCRAQWIHSVNAERNLSVLAKADLESKIPSLIDDTPKADASSLDRTDQS